MGDIVKGKINKIETFGLVDGPGVRYVLFLQGCKMRCKYCHNPETWDILGGEEKTAKDAFEHAVRYKNYWKNNGGITVSGGEPLLQIDFLIEFFKLAKEENIHTALDTSGNPFDINDIEWMKKFKELIQYVDLFLLDIKMMDENKHIELTGKSNKNILKMAEYLSNNNKEMWIRHVLVSGLTDDENDLIKLRDFVKNLKTVKKIEILPYHSLGVFKYQDLGIEYPLIDAITPSDFEIKKAEKIINNI